MIFLWIKALHVFAVIAWMAGLFYLPRLFVYHCRQVLGSETDELFKLMEGRLMRIIMRPAMVVALVAGAFAVASGGFNWSDHWLSAKLLGVIGMAGYHGLLERHLAAFRKAERLKPERYYRIINEIPSLLLIWIVVMVVVKPF